MEEQTPSPEYLKGFNEGYVIAKELPDLSDKLSSIKSESDRMQGFQDGREQYGKDKIKDLRPDWLKQKNAAKDTLSKDRDLDIEI